MSIRRHLVRAGSRRACAVLLPMALLLVSACAGEVTSQDLAAETADPAVLATLDGEPITLLDLEEVIGDQLATLEHQYGSLRFQLLDTGLQQVIRDRVLEIEATSRGVSVDELLAAELPAAEVTDAEVVAFFQQNQSRMQGRPLELVRPAISEHLAEQRREEGMAELTDRLLAERQLHISLEPYRAAIETEGHPSQGPANAAVTLVEFSDFECPYCGSFIATLERVQQEYEGRIRVVYRQFPLSQIHPNAQKAAEAALCAEDQGKFWEMHDLMFAEQHALGVADLQAKAASVGMDAEVFNACLSSGQFAERVEADLRAGRRLGVDGTPALFVNGRHVEGGAVGFEALTEIIDEELERAAR